MTELRASTGAVTALGGQLDNVAADVGAVIDGAPALSSLIDSHGTIGFPADFAGASEARSAAVGATKVVSEKMAETLRQAAKAYERGDVEAAEKLKAQADRLGGGRSSGSSNTAGGPSGGQDGGMQAGGQMMGQFSQMAGQMMQGITQPVQGIVQGLTQMPQQVMQGVQGIVQAATQGAAGGGATGPEAPPAGAAESDGAGAPDKGEKAPAQAGIMSEERMRELQGLPPLQREEAPHGTGPAPLPRVHPRTARDL
ncbi:ESX-1 secretion-associated protein [Mycobacterium sp. NPDC050441]|uniref:ESX-1 secretion-associated protein n=1 Tax=Mycobacterium sp. NPDC050441 TaxID=3155403 RepID=UPI0033FD2D6D